MRALVLSDIHGDTEALDRILHRESDVDLVLVLGDLTDAGLDDPAGTAGDVIGLLDQHGVFVKAVPGNMDDEAVLKQLIDHRMNLHKQLFSMDSYEFVGFGGGSTPFDTPFEPDDDERGDVLAQLLDRTQADHRVIVSHQPPHGTRIDRTEDGTQAGSERLRALLEEEAVDAVFSGHIHEARGTDELGGALLVNPGPVNEGYYAVAEFGAEEVDVELRE